MMVSRMPTSTTAEEVKRLLRVISGSLEKKDIDHTLELKSEGFWHIEIISYLSDAARRLERDLNGDILSNIDAKAVQVGQCRTNIIWFNKGRPLPYLDFEASRRYAYDYLLTDDTKQELEATHSQQKHEGWPAFRCVLCRGDLRKEGYNIPFYDKGVWKDSR